MPFCSRCGKELPVDASFCMYCGTSIVQQPQELTGKEVQAAPQTVEQWERPLTDDEVRLLKKGGVPKSVLYVVTGVTALFGFMTLVYMFAAIYIKPESYSGGFFLGGLTLMLCGVLYVMGTLGGYSTAIIKSGIAYQLMGAPRISEKWRGRKKINGVNFIGGHLEFRVKPPSLVEASMVSDRQPVLVTFSAELTERKKKKAVLLAVNGKNLKKPYRCTLVEEG